MPAGRPKKPTALKKLEGTYRDDREIENQMMPSTIDYAPSAPKFLSKSAKKEWKSVCEELISLDMLHRVDLALLAAYCQEMSTYVQAAHELAIEGPIIPLERENGSTYYMPSPWVAIKNSALKNAMSIAAQFGFTPSARTKIRAEVKQPKDPFEEMMGMDDD